MISVHFSISNPHGAYTLVSCPAPPSEVRFAQTAICSSSAAGSSEGADAKVQKISYIDATLESRSQASTRDITRTLMVKISPRGKQHDSVMTAGAARV